MLLKPIAVVMVRLGGVQNSGSGIQNGEKQMTLRDSELLESIHMTVLLLLWEVRDKSVFVGFCLGCWLDDYFIFSEVENIAKRNSCEKNVELVLVAL